MPPMPDPAAAAPGPRLRPWLALPAAGAVLGALVAYAGGPRALAHTVSGVSPPFLLLAACAYGWFFLLRGLRWAFLLRSAGADPRGFLLPAALESVAWMISTVVPFKAGDAVRAVVLSRRRDLPLAAVAGTVGMERALDLAGLAFAASIGLGVLSASDVTIPAAWAPVVALAWALPLVGIGCAFGLAVLLRRKPRTTVVRRLLGQLLDGVLAISRQPRLLLPAALWTLGIKTAQIAVYLALLNAFLPEVPLLAAAVVPLFLLSFLVALTPGHVGTYEAAFVLVFALVGLPAANLAAAAVAVHVTAIAIVTTLGLASLAAIQLRRGQVTVQETPLRPLRPTPAEPEEAAP